MKEIQERKDKTKETIMEKEHKKDKKRKAKKKGQ